MKDSKESKFAVEEGVVGVDDRNDFKIEDKGGERNDAKMGWPKATFLLLAETIALGVLSFPSVCHRIGIVGAELPPAIPH